VLAAKAESVASEINGEAFREKPESFGEGALSLIPSRLAAESAFVMLAPVSEGVDGGEEGLLELLTDVESLINLPGLRIETAVLYKGVEAQKHAMIEIPLGDAQRFPSVPRYASENGLRIPRPAADRADEAGTGGLSQSYDAESGVFTQHISSTLFFTSNIPNGMMTNSPVELVFPRELELKLIRNGEAAPYRSGQRLSQSGRYSARITVSLPEAATEGVLGPECRFDFEIAGDAVSGPVFYNAPPGFYIESITLAGDEANAVSGSTAYLGEDGSYELVVADTTGAAPPYYVYLPVLSTRPALRLDGVSNGGFTFGRVRLVPGPDVVRMTVLRDGKPYEPTDRTISSAGLFTVTVENAAGNASRYQFRVLFSLAGFAVAVLLALLATAFGMRISYLRSHMRVR
jgi:hypothetical protein